MELRHQLRILRSWLWLMVLGVLLAGGSAYLVSTSLPKVFQSTATLLVGQSAQAANPDYNQLLASQRLSQTYAELATTNPLLKQVISNNGLSTTTKSFRKRIIAEAPRDSTLVRLTVEDEDPARAARLANDLAAVMIAASPAIAGRDTQVQKFIDADLAATQTLITDTQHEIQRLTDLTARNTKQEQRLQALQGRIISLRQTYATLLGFSSNSGANLLTVIDPASAPEQPASPRILLNTLVAGLLGLLLALGLILLREYLDDRLKSAADVETVLRLPVLGTISKMKGGQEIHRLATLLYPRSPGAEAYRSLRTNIEFASLDEPLKTLLVTSSIPGEGKTTTAANLAVVMAQAGHRTILLDADFRTPGIHKIFRLPNTTGLSALIRWDGSAPDDVAQVTEEEHLRVITTGPLPPIPPRSCAPSGCPRFSSSLRVTPISWSLTVRQSRRSPNSVILASIADGTLFVVDARRTRRGTARNAREAIGRAGARVLGVVLNRVQEGSGGVYADDYFAAYGDTATVVHPSAIPQPSHSQPPSKPVA